jgi:hypothetical protein
MMVISLLLSHSLASVALQKGEQLKGKKRTKKTEDQSELEVEPRRTPEKDPSESRSWYVST